MAGTLAVDGGAAVYRGDIGRFATCRGGGGMLYLRFCESLAGRSDPA